MSEKLTKKDIEKIQSEIDHRKLVVRPQALEDVKTARAQGDLSENFEYKAAKQFKNKNDSRIRYLEKVLKTAQVIDDSSADDEVGIHNTVTVYIEEDDEEETYRITTSISANSMKDRISIDSPMGQALLGKKVGDRVLITVNSDYSYYVVIRKIENTEEDESETLRKF